MSPRDTSTGGVLEAMILPALNRGGYAHQTQVRVGQRCGGGIHKVDALATKDNQRVFVSVKWQQTGEAEQKVPFELMCLADAVGHTTRSAPISYSGATAGSYGTISRPEDWLIIWFMQPSSAWCLWKRLFESPTTDSCNRSDL